MLDSGVIRTSCLLSKVKQAEQQGSVVSCAPLESSWTDIKAPCRPHLQVPMLGMIVSSTDRGT